MSPLAFGVGKDSIIRSGSIVTNGLVLHLDGKQYPGSGTTWTDLSGNGNTGTLVNGVGYNSDNGGSLVFDGVNDYVENSSPNLGITGNASATLSCWFYYTGPSSTYNALFQYGNGPSSGDTFALGLNAAGAYDVSFQFNGGNGTRSHSNVYLPNTWNNLVGTKTPGAINTTTKLYLNGVELTIAASTTITPNVSSRVIRVGRWTNEGSPLYYTGRVSNCSIYNRALTAQEIQQNFNALRSRFSI
jgi:hypothetical protein